MATVANWQSIKLDIWQTCCIVISPATLLDTHYTTREVVLKRGPKANGHSNGSLENGEKMLVKSTYLLDPILKQNLAVVALVKGKDQSDIVREALTQYLTSINCDPTKPPKLPQYSD